MEGRAFVMQWFSRGGGVALLSGTKSTEIFDGFGDYGVEEYEIDPARGFSSYACFEPYAGVSLGFFGFLQLYYGYV